MPTVDARDWLWVLAYSAPVAAVVGVLAEHHLLTGLAAFVAISVALVVARAVRARAGHRTSPR